MSRLQPESDSNRQEAVQQIIEKIVTHADPSHELLQPGMAVEVVIQEDPDIVFPNQQLKQKKLMRQWQNALPAL